MKRTAILLSAVIMLITTPALSARKSSAIQLSTSIGLGTGFPLAPDVFESSYEPSFGAVLDFEVQKSMVGISIAADYNFFISNGLEPNDANILTMFVNLKIKPIAKASVRPYILIGGGYFRYWIVDLNFAENTTGYQGGAGVELDISKTQRLFIDVKQVVGRTRQTNAEGENTSYIPIRIGMTFLF